MDPSTRKDYFAFLGTKVSEGKSHDKVLEKCKQIKDAWLDQGFGNTSFNLVTAHIIFSILVYTLI